MRSLIMDKNTKSLLKDDSEYTLKYLRYSGVGSSWEELQINYKNQYPLNIFAGMVLIIKDINKKEVVATVRQFTEFTLV